MAFFVLETMMAPLAPPNFGSSQTARVFVARIQMRLYSSTARCRCEPLTRRHNGIKSKTGSAEPVARYR